MSWRELEPRASRLWIRFAPRRWPGAGRPALDLAGRRITWPAAPRGPESRLPAPAPMADVVVLPPVEKAHTTERSELASALVAKGSFVLDQRFLDGFEDPAGPAAARSLRVVDLVATTLAEAATSTDSIPEGAIVPVPLLPGVSAEESAWSVFLSRLAAAKPAAVVGVAPELSPVDRRRIVERLGDESFERVHHARGSDSDLERRFARAVSAAGLNPFFERPAPAGLPPRAERNRRIAALLFEAGERWLALGRGEGDAAALVAAARHVDAAPQEIEALARERQLALLPWLSPLARRTVEAFVETGASPLLAELRAEWLGVEVPA